MATYCSLEDLNSDCSGCQDRQTVAEWNVMLPNIALRVAEPEDAARLAALAVQTWLHTYATGGIRQSIARYVHEHLTVDAFISQVARSDATTLVANADDHLVGYAAVEYAKPCPVRESVTTHLDKLFVQEPFIGAGVGYALLNAATAEARRRGAVSGYWLTVNSGNERARAFYRRQGLQDIGVTHFDLYGERHENRILYAPSS
jgi:diamine N-acetyltransferase